MGGADFATATMEERVVGNEVGNKVGNKMRAIGCAGRGCWLREKEWIAEGVGLGLGAVGSGWS